MSASLPPRVERFLGKSWEEKRQILSSRAKDVWYRALARLPVPIVKRLDSGFLWIVWNDVIRESILRGTFEKSERDFVKNFLQPGMTVLDIGAYYGLYTLTASRRVGLQGRVIAFEPSRLQMGRLQRHLRLNRCKNVRTESIALSNVEGESEFFAVSGRSAGCSSLRLPNVTGPVKSTRVLVSTLDSYLRRSPLPRIDFIKADVEGGELDLFRGATNLFSRGTRPVILCELQDIRTEPWGYRANEVASFLQGLGFIWFKPVGDGKLLPLPFVGYQFDGNYVAVPQERMNQIEEIIANERHG